MARRTTDSASTHHGHTTTTELAPSYTGASDVAIKRYVRAGATARLIELRFSRTDVHNHYLRRVTTMSIDTTSRGNDTIGAVWTSADGLAKVTLTHHAYDGDRVQYRYAFTLADRGSGPAVT